MDYALKNERLSLEVEVDITMSWKINLIVIGLPIESC